MKKVLFLLLVTSISYGQALFDKGIKVTTNINDTTSTKVVVKSANNVYNYQDIVKFQKEKGFLSTGLIKNGLISANGDLTKFNITAGIGIISNFDNPENPISTLINFPAFNSITPTYLNTGNITYVAINSTPAVVMQATPFTPEQRRSLITLGAVIHSNLTTINVLNNISAPSNASTNQLHDFMEAVGALNLTGNKYTENGANLQLNKSAGVLFKLGSNFAVDWRNPHQIAQAGGTAITFRYRTQNGTESADMTSISPGLYDLNNVLTTVPNNKFTIQTVTVFQTGLTRIQWGQSLYDDLQSAKNALLTRNFVVENNIKENGVTRAYIIVRNSTTSLQNIADAYISEAQKFGGVASGGVALTLANIVTALGYTPENLANKQNSLAVDGTGIKYPTVDATNTALDLKQNTLTNPITGTGTVNTIPKWTGTTTQGNSNITDSGTLVSVNSNTKLNGNISLGSGNPTSPVMFDSNGFPLSGASNVIGLRIRPTIGSDATTSFTGILSNPFTTNNLATGNVFHFSPNSIGLGISSTVSAQYGFYIGSSFTSATNNYAFRSMIPSGANNWNLYMDGTAKNYLNGNVLIKQTSDNGIDPLQINGTVSFSAGTTANQGVIKSQLDLKANIESPTFTGVPSVPLAVTGTNTPQIASTAFVTNALSSGSYQISVNRTESNLIEHRIFNNSTTTVSLENNNSTGTFRQATNNSTGNHNKLVNESTGIANVNMNNAGGLFNSNINNINTGTFNGNLNSGSGIFNSNTNTSTGIFNDSYNTGSGIFDKRRNDSTGILNYYNSSTASTGDLQQYLKNGAVTSKINHLGEITAPKLTMTGTIELKSYTVATLPTGVEGATAYVTDAIAPIYLGALTGGGTVKCPVFYNGTNWVSH